MQVSEGGEAQGPNATITAPHNPYSVKNVERGSGARFVERWFEGLNVNVAHILNQEHFRAIIAIARDGERGLEYLFDYYGLRYHLTTRA